MIPENAIDKHLAEAAGDIPGRRGKVSLNRKGIKKVAVVSEPLPWEVSPAESNSRGVERF